MVQLLPIFLGPFQYQHSDHYKFPLWGIFELFLSSAHFTSESSRIKKGLPVDMVLSERPYQLELYMTPDGFTLNNLVSQLEHATTKPTNIDKEGHPDEASIQILAMRVAAV